MINTVLILILIAAIGTLVATFLMPVLQLNTCTMNRIYKSGDIVVFSKTNNIKENDIVAYYHKNKILISRVIEILKENQSKEMINNEYDLTLFTCTLDGKTRYTVRLNRV